MTKTNVAAVATRIYELLDPVESSDRQRAIAAALTLLGEAGVSVPQAGLPPGGTGAIAGSPAAPAAAGNLQGAKAFFDTKQPINKIEELAVAARFRETVLQQESHDSASLESVFKAARRNFDKKNFRRDLNNAKVRGFFNRGSDNALAHYGQNFVDALPNRETADAIRRPRSGSRRKATKKTAGGAAKR
jgi:hypothetical protein